MGYYYKLALMRKRKGLTQAEAADLLEISRSALIMYENGKLDVPLSIFIKMARLYGFDTLEVLGVNDPSESCGIVFDINYYYMIKAHVCYVVEKEAAVNREMYGEDVYDEEYYADRYISILKDLLSEERYDGNEDIQAEAERDRGNIPQFISVEAREAEHNAEH